MLSFRHLIASIAAVVVTVFALALPDVAHARWLRAESQRFIVYSDGDEQTLRDNVQDLENFDRLLRGIHGLDPNAPTPRKLEIYLIRSDREMELLRPGWGEIVAGYYSAGSEDIFAVGIRERGDNQTLLHEYVHHFMLQNFPQAYPAWLVEGYAEFFGASEFTNAGVTFGMPLNSRGYALLGSRWLPLEQVVGRERPMSASLETMDAYYAQAWAVTHWFMADEQRRQRLFRYMSEIGAGADPLEAFDRATGMSLEDFQRDLRRYVGGRIRYSQAPASTFPAVAMTVTQLPASADDLLLLNQRQKIGLPDEAHQETLRMIREEAPRHGEDPFALLVLGHAELHIGDADEGERILRRLIEIEPRNVEARQLLASRRYDLASEASDYQEIERLLGEAHDLLAEAATIAPADYRTHMWLGRIREVQPGYPTADDVRTWMAAYRLAPQLGDVRLGLGRALMQGRLFNEAIVVLEPLANAPHGGGARDYAARLVELARARQPPIAYVPSEEDEEGGEE